LKFDGGSQKSGLEESGMSIRTYLNENPMVAGGIAAGLVLIAIIGGVWYLKSSGTPEPLTGKPDLSKGFYSDDDGKNFFVDVIGHVTPFKHNGKDAVRAYVFRCGSTTFVGLLGRNTDAAKSHFDVKTLGGDYKAVFTTSASPPIFEIKKPQGAKWIPVTSQPNDPWHQELAVQCPGGGSDLAVPVAPGQQ
jgi:hypothetical protein